VEHFLEAFSWINMRFLLEGLLITIQVSLLSIAFSFIIGGILGIIRYVKIPVLSSIIGVIIDIIRNLPLLLIIFFTYFGLPNMGVRLNIFWSAVAAMAVFQSAMLAEIIRGGIVAVPKGQMEAARSTGLTYTQAMRIIILPQALKKMIPPIVGQFISLVKDTSLATVIVLPELTYSARIIYSQDSNLVLPMFFMITLLYFLICYCLAKLSVRLDRSLS